MAKFSIDGESWTIEPGNVVKTPRWVPDHDTSRAFVALDQALDPVEVILGRPATVLVREAVIDLKTKVRAAERSEKERIKALEGELSIYRRWMDDLTPAAYALALELERRNRMGRRELADPIKKAVTTAKEFVGFGAMVPASSGCCEGSSMPAGDQ